MYKEDGNITHKSIDNIYENFTVTKGKFGQETTDSNATRIQSSELTGSDSVRIRSSRSAVVCLVLLCVLLLTAVIVLCVTLTQERQQLISKNENLTNEREQLMLKNTNLTNESEQLKWEKKALKSFLGKMDGWIYYKSSFYFISSDGKSWTESRRYCTERGADLIIINNREEQDFVKNISGYAHVWIGLTDSDEEGTWKWVDGSTLNSGFWWPGKPNYYTGNEDCALSYISWWYDYSCYSAFKWICETSILHVVLP
ncbi:CD209 antigen-like protein E isoform X2 [Onychostoma macrolepis]|uniref:CD209 antigen-like protein E isoform X2 n=1 Tax=Onychostoma macrolepis TaxID=369639 RepID=UPI00272AE928|nr:CD209 antigen-like protein E isoform X2 [Onychostoma macrolepis]